VARFSAPGSSEYARRVVDGRVRGRGGGWLPVTAPQPYPGRVEVTASGAAVRSRAATVDLHEVGQRDLPAREALHWGQLSRCNQPSRAPPRSANMNRAPRFLAFGPVACS
jgi:hypothetical protein